MKKNYLFGLLSLFTLLFAASCQEEDMAGQYGDTATVTFEVSTPMLATRAVGDGTTAKKLYVAVYENQNGTLAGPLEVSLIDDGETVAFNERVATVNLALAKNKEYSVIFWAETDNNGEAMFNINWDDRELTLKSSLKANQEKYDAFWAQKTVTLTGALSEKVELKRPFAQLNIGTSDKAAAADAGIVVKNSQVVVKGAYTTFDLQSGDATNEGNVTYAMEAIAAIKEETFPAADQSYLSLNYLLMNTDKSTVDVDFSYEDVEDNDAYELNFTSVPVQRNWRTNIYGTLLTNSANYTVEILPGFDAEYNDDKSVVVNSAETFVEAFEEAVSGEGVNVIVLGGDINLNDLFDVNNAPATRAAGDDPSLTIAAEKELTIDLNGKKLSATSTQTGKNYNMFSVRGTLTMKNGTIEYKHEGENMEWNNSTNLFDVTAGGVLNLNGVTAKNLGGSDMGFVAHLNNWGVVTLNVDNSTLESNYVPVRVFNSGPDMNNVTIKNSALKGGSYAFWVHNYTVDDFGTEAKAEEQKAKLNLNIYNQGNTFSPDLNGIRYGFTNSVKADAYGITKTVSEDGTEVTLGTMIENALVRRGVAGAEENQTIKKVVVEEGIATLYDRTFRRFYALEEVVLPSSLTTIGAAGSGVFQSCTNLKNIVLPENVTVLGKGSFQECSSLESINIPAGVTRIEENCLRATGLKSVEFHAGVTYFGAQAFRDCKQLTEVIINAPEFTVEANAFGVMAGELPGTTIYVANAEMKAYLESTLAYKNQFTIVAPNVISNANEFKEALNKIEDGGIIVLNDNICFDKETCTHNSGTWYDGIYYVGDKSFTIDLNGYTISQDGSVNDYLLNFKNVGSKSNTITLKNGTIDAGTTAFCAICTSTTSENELTINTQDINIINNLSNGSTIKLRGGAKLNVLEGTKITGKNSYLGIECVASTVNIYDGAEIYMNGTSSYCGCLVGACGNGTVNVYGGYGKGVKGGFIAMTSGGTINIEGGEWIANTDGTIGNNSNVYVLTAQNNKYESGYVGASIINVTGGTFRGGMDAWILNDVNVEKAELNISGGNFNANPSLYLIEGAIVNEANGIWTVE